MVTSTGLPESLAEFLDLWCGDLLSALPVKDRDRLVNSIQLICDGGIAWPSRLYVQRLVEVAQGRVTEDAVQGELLTLHGGGIAAALERLQDPHLRAAAVQELGQFQPTADVVRKVTSAQERGELSSVERVAILQQMMRLSHLSEPVPLPGHLASVPVGYPVTERPAQGRHGPIRQRSVSLLVPAMVSYVPQRAGSEHRFEPGPGPFTDELSPNDQWPAPHDSAPTVQYHAGSTLPAKEAPELSVPFHDEVDALLRRRGWYSCRDREQRRLGHDEWTWPPSEEDPWWQPTIIDFDGARFRVRLASTSLMEAPRTQFLAGYTELRREIATIEGWSQARD